MCRLEERIDVFISRFVVYLKMRGRVHVGHFDWGCCGKSREIGGVSEVSGCSTQALSDETSKHN